MATECSAEKFEFREVSGHVVVAGFDGGAITSDAGALLLGAADRTIRLTERFATCFTDRRSADHVEHDLRTPLLQRVVGIALSCDSVREPDPGKKLRKALIVSKKLIWSWDHHRRRP